MQINTPEAKVLVPAISGRPGETGIIVKHQHELFSSITILFRAINFGKITLIAQYKCSDFEYRAKTVQSCCPFDTPKTTAESLDTTPELILNGQLIDYHFADGSHVDFMKEPGQAPNKSIARTELYHAFYFLTDAILFPRMRDFVENF